MTGPSNPNASEEVGFTENILEIRPVDVVCFRVQQIVQIALELAMNLMSHWP
jgi:hypothetical protein